MLFTFQACSLTTSEAPQTFLLALPSYSYTNRPFLRSKARQTFLLKFQILKFQSRMTVNSGMLNPFQVLCIMQSPYQEINWELVYNRDIPTAVHILQVWSISTTTTFPKNVQKYGTSRVQLFTNRRV